MTYIYLGVDMACQTFQAAVWMAGHEQDLGSYPNTSQGFEDCAQALRQAYPALDIWLIVEPTGGYELPLACFAHELGWRVSAPNPKRVRDWAKAEGRRAKTDRQDARMLARFGAERQPYAWQPLPQEVQELESLLRRQTDLEQLLLQEQNRQGSLSHHPNMPAAVTQSIQDVIEALNNALTVVQNAIRSHLRQHAWLHDKVKLLRSVPGVGARNVLPLLVTLVRWELLTQGQGRAKGLVAYIGLDPKTHESGTSVYKRAAISRMGNRGLRRMLYMGALGGKSTKNLLNPLRLFFERLVSRGKPKKLALVACARKILTWAWAVFRQNTAFDFQRFHLPILTS